MEYRYLGVITGDLYRSTAGLERGIAYQNIMEHLRRHITQSKKYDIEGIEFFRGDSFQISCKDPSYIVEIAAYIRAYLLSLSDEGDDNRYDARMSLNINKFNRFSGYSNSVYEKAFIDSGRALDNMPKNKMLLFSSDMKALTMSLNSSVLLLDILLNMLSKQQAEVLRLGIENEGLDMHYLVDQTKKTRQTIHKLVSRSGVEKLLEYLRLSQKEIKYHMKEMY
ncbi:hypothetical protein H5A40_07520 [Pectobacterium brasiliense]|uniref:hypothetical protein n=1 Tax=Pectobacterium brasiliense TaxID=180957 RepID=UPI001968AC23|nr:hypothetical protein [Pectobacterium brasiliense]QSD36945.1 hypothetical protein H5A40_07520 [Pectobacterium brasiliense]